MSGTSPTRLWLATIYIETRAEFGLEGIRTQRLVVAELTDEAPVVRREVAKFAKEWYGSLASVENLVLVPSVAALPTFLNGVDLIQKSQFSGLERCHTPASVVLEMGYNDYSPSFQETPSRIESLRYPNYGLATAAAKHAFEYVSRIYPEFESYWTFRTDYCELSTDESKTVEEVEDLIDEMMEHYVGEEKV